MAVLYSYSLQVTVSANVKDGDKKQLISLLYIRKLTYAYVVKVPEQLTLTLAETVTFRSCSF